MGLWPWGNTYIMCNGASGAYYTDHAANAWLSVAKTSSTTIRLYLNAVEQRSCTVTAGTYYVKIFIYTNAENVPVPYVSLDM